MIIRLIMLYLKYRLNKLKLKQDTEYIFFNGTGNDYPNYLVFTDDEEYRNKLHKLI